MLGSNEMFYLDAEGKKQDADLHAGILDDPHAEEAAALGEVLRAIDDGYSEDLALSLFGTVNTAARLAERRKVATAA